MAEIQADVDTTVNVEIDVTAREWIEAADKEEIEEMRKLLGGFNGLSTDKYKLRYLIEHLETNEVKGISNYEKNELIKELYEIE